MNNIRIIDLRTTDVADFVFARADISVQSATEAAGGIIDDVRARGAQAVIDATQRFDRVDLTSLRVAQDAIDDAWATAAPDLRKAIEVSIARVTAGHRAQLPESATVELSDGATITQEYFPVARVGLYAPGGLAAYASSVVMNVVPAQVAQVPSIVVTSPPDPATGLPSPSVLAACAALGVDEVYAMGGAQAIAALAYGLPDDGRGNALAPVDVITGPGNVFVAAAKSLVRGAVGIDAVAGPTEIAIIADESATPAFVAADLLSQAEHDPNAACVLLTTSFAFAEAVVTALEAGLKQTANSERARTALNGPQSMIVVVDDLDAAVHLANRYGAEHLEIMTHSARSVAGRVTNAGAVFVGDFSPVSLGDYAAGSNHVLPTAGTSRFSSGLSVHAFLRPVQVIEYDRDALSEIAADVVVFSEAEGLPAHGEAISARFA